MANFGIFHRRLFLSLNRLFLEEARINQVLGVGVDELDGVLIGLLGHATKAGVGLAACLGGAKGGLQSEFDRAGVLAKGFVLGDF